MRRYDMFGPIHKGLRALMYDTALTLQQTDFNNAAQTDALLGQVELVIDLFDKHAHSEDGKVFSAIAEHEPALVSLLEDEHVKDHELGEGLRTAVEAFATAFTDEEKYAAGNTLNNAFLGFMIFNIEHMQKEETKVTEALHAHYSDDQLHGITHTIVADIEPQMMQQYTKWMLRGQSNNEIIGWLRDVKENAPDFIFQSLMDAASLQLNSQRWQMVQEELLDGSMVM